MPAGIIFSTDSQYDTSLELNRVVAADENASWYKKARYYRKDPTVSLARAILSAPIIENGWNIVGEDKKAIELVKKVLLPHKQDILRTAILSCIDYGWQAWEIRPLTVRDQPYRHIKIKPLRHELTTIIVDKNGFPKGVVNTPVQNYIDGNRSSRLDVKVGLPYTTFCAASEEYGNPLGYPILKNCESVFRSYEEVEDAAQRYVKRIAGAHWVLWYPEGTTVEIDGNPVGSDVVAERILENLRSSGRIALPVSSAELSQIMSSEKNSGDAKKSGWDIKLLSETGGIDPFLDRQSYLDTLKMRALFVPERTALEGHFGTKADSSEHADIAMLAISTWGNSVIEWFNSPYGFIASILAFNDIEYYPGRVRIQTRPFQDDERSFFREVFRTVVNNVKNFATVVDMDMLGQKTGVPIDIETWKAMRNTELEINSQRLNPNTGNGQISRGQNKPDEEDKPDKEPAKV